MKVVEQLRQYRDDVRPFLGQPSDLTQQGSDELPPTEPCNACGGISYWRRPTGRYRDGLLQDRLVALQDVSSQNTTNHINDLLNRQWYSQRLVCDRAV
jgi:hypothetical protein